MRQSISSVFADRARRTPDDVVLIGAEGELTAAELDHRATQTARVLLRQGVVRNDRVIVALPNTLCFVIACVAIWRVGATPMPLDPTMNRNERAALEESARPSAVFGVPSPTGTVAVVEQSAAALESAAALPDTWADSWKAPATSGSTGWPKVVASTAPALVDPDDEIAPFVPRSATQLVTSPLWHSTGFTYAFRGLMSGHRVVMLPAFDEFAFLDAVETHRVTWTVLSPPSVHRLVRLPADVRGCHDVSSLETVLHIGGRCPTPDKRALIDWLGPDRVVEVYAGSESHGLTMISGEDWLAHPGSVGTGIAGTELRIRRADGSTAATGEVGTVWMRRGTRPSYRYLGAPSRRDVDGWDTLGDIGFLSADGFLYVVDREADVIRGRGGPLYPADVEQALESHPLVRGAVAYAESDTLAVIVDIDRHEVTTDALADHLVDRMGVHARPHRITLTRNPIRNDAGKIRRTELAR